MWCIKSHRSTFGQCAIRIHQTERVGTVLSVTAYVHETVPMFVVCTCTLFWLASTTYYNCHGLLLHAVCSKWWMLTNSVQVQITNIGTLSWTYVVILKTVPTLSVWWMCMAHCQRCFCETWYDTWNCSVVFILQVGVMSTCTAFASCNWLYIA